MQSPSNSQLKAITHGTGPMLVLAGPGFGKTFVMIQRVIHLISDLKVDPKSILVISFSKASATELWHRFNQQPGAKQGVNFSTFHACFFHILKTDLGYTSRDIITPKEQREILKILFTDPLFEETGSVEKGEEYLSKFSFYKNRGIKFMEEKEEEHFCRLFHAYQKEMHSRHRLDFDDMGLLCLQLLKKNPASKRFWQDKFSHILIDEFQDINPIQFEIVRILAEKKKNLFVVGDDDQAIYSFRGASPKIMLSFEQLYPSADRVLLETNYRCSANIVKESLKVIVENKERFLKEILPFHPPKEEVIYRSFTCVFQEYQYISRKIEQLLERGTSPSEISCIFRTNQQMSGLAEHLFRKKIPFTMKEKVRSIFGHYIARDILSYLQFFLEGRKRKDFLVIMNKPLRYFSRNACEAEQVDWEKIGNYYTSKPYMQNIIEALKKQERWVKSLDLYGAVSYIRKVVGYEAYLKEYIKSRKETWEEAEEILDFIHNSTRGTTSLEHWKQEIADYEEALRASRIQQTEGVQLITMHACKGLEYPFVFLPDCNEGKIPHKKSVTEEEIEEERRMFYVAMTRAIEQLEILYIQDKMGKKLQVSRFLPIREKKRRVTPPPRSHQTHSCPDIHQRLLLPSPTPHRCQ